MMVLVRSQPIADASYLLIDDIGERMCASWHTVPNSTRHSDSLVELAYACATAALCSFDDVMARLPTLLELGILRRNGTVAKKVVEELNRRGARRMNIEDEVVTALPAGEDGENEGEET